jgi:hypothetical protein
MSMLYNVRYFKEAVFGGVPKQKRVRFTFLGTRQSGLIGGKMVIHKILS